MVMIEQVPFGEVSDEHVRVDPIMGIESLLARFNITAEPLFAEAGIAMDLLADANNTLPFYSLGRLLERCAEATGCPHFGLLVGQDHHLQTLGLLGDLLPHCADVETALAYLQDFFHLHDRGAVPTLAVGGNVAVLGYNVLVPDLPGFRQIQDATMAIALNMMRSLCGPDWKPRLLRLALRKPVDLKPYRALFGCEIELNAECPEMVFPRKDLRQAIPGASNMRFCLLKEELESLRKKSALGFAARVRRVILVFLVLQRCSQDAVAGHFAMHRRTLNRMLAAEGQTYRALADEARRMLTLRMLQHTDLNLGQVAAALGYADASVFNRACHRWLGMPPSEWRKAGVRTAAVAGAVRGAKIS